MTDPPSKEGLMRAIQNGKISESCGTLLEKAVKIKTKKVIYQECVLSVIMYGSDLLDTSKRCIWTVLGQQL